MVVFPATTAPDYGLVEPPEDMPAGQKPVWREWAPLALERRTLHAETVPGFRLLCELEVKRRVLAGGKDDRLYLVASKQVEGMLGRFCLAPFGKPVAVEKPKAAVNPFATLGGVK